MKKKERLKDTIDLEDNNQIFVYGKIAQQKNTTVFNPVPNEETCSTWGAHAGQSDTKTTGGTTSSGYNYGSDAIWENKDISYYK